MESLTIFTPTYNRAYILNQLYESLLRQTDSCFEWVIVDDGSTDDTETLVQGWVQENQINIIYKKQENQGKHIAINVGASLAKGELFFIVDSDDYLVDDAVEKIRNFWEDSHPDETISGIISYRKFLDGNLIGTPLPSSLKKCKMWETTAKYHSIGDKVVVYRTRIFREYQYPKFADEKFLGESYVFNQIDRQYDMLILNEMLYVCDYRTDGLSQNFRRLYRNNPRGFLAVFEQDFQFLTSVCTKIKTAAHILCLRLKLRCFWRGFKGKGFLSKIVATPFAIALYFKIFVFKAEDVRAIADSQKK